MRIYRSPLVDKTFINKTWITHFHSWLLQVRRIKSRSVKKFRGSFNAITLEGCNIYSTTRMIGIRRRGHRAFSKFWVCTVYGLWRILSWVLVRPRFWVCQSFLRIVFTKYNLIRTDKTNWTMSIISLKLRWFCYKRILYLSQVWRSGFSITVRLQRKYSLRYRNHDVELDYRSRLRTFVVHVQF